jgi:hypothetical protein
MADDSIQPVQPKVVQLEVQPEAALEKVVDEASASEAETSELIRIEEALAYAREMAKRAGSVRRPTDVEDVPPTS